MKETTVSMVRPNGQKGNFNRDEHGAILPTVENFYNFCAEKKLMGVKCKRCAATIWPPRGICPKCLGDVFEWIEFVRKGKLLTFTIIHFPPSQFQALAPYAVGIMKLEEGPQLPGMIRQVRLADLKIGMDLQVDFETAIPKEWPRWPRYFFKPVD